MLDRTVRNTACWQNTCKWQEVAVGSQTGLMCNNGNIFRLCLSMRDVKALRQLNKVAEENRCTLMCH